MRKAFNKREQWFLDRVGKRVYRNKTSCLCRICKNVGVKGLVVHDQFHATYLWEIEGTYTHEGSPTRYFDWKIMSYIYGIYASIKLKFNKPE